MAASNRNADGLPREHGYIDHKPVVKLFTPDAGRTWLLTEIDPDDPDRRLRPVRPWVSAVPNSALSACPNSNPYAASSAFRSSAISFHANHDAIRLRRRGAGAWRDQSVRCVMNDQHSTAAPLSEMTRRYIWLLSELHGGNQFSKEQLWRWLTEANATIAKAEGGAS